MAMFYQSKEGIGGMRQKPRRVGPLQPVPKGLARLPGAMWEGAGQFAQEMAGAQDLVLGAAGARLADIERTMRGVNTTPGGPDDPYGPKLIARELTPQQRYYEDKAIRQRDMGRFDRNVDDLIDTGKRMGTAALHGMNIYGPPGLIAAESGISAGLNWLGERVRPGGQRTPFGELYQGQLDKYGALGDWSMKKLEDTTSRLENLGVGMPEIIASEMLVPFHVPLPAAGRASRRVPKWIGSGDPVADAIPVGGSRPAGSGGLSMASARAGTPLGKARAAAESERLAKGYLEEERAAFRAAEQERLALEELGADTDYAVTVQPEAGVGGLRRGSRGVEPRPADAEFGQIWQRGLIRLRDLAREQDVDAAVETLAGLDELEHGSNVAFEARSMAQDFSAEGNNRAAAALMEAADRYAASLPESIRDQYSEEAWRMNRDWRQTPVAQSERQARPLYDRPDPETQARVNEELYELEQRASDAADTRSRGDLQDVMQTLAHHEWVQNPAFEMYRLARVADPEAADMIYDVVRQWVDEQPENTRHLYTRHAYEASEAWEHFARTPAAERTEYMERRLSRQYGNEMRPERLGPDWTARYRAFREEAGTSGDPALFDAEMRDDLVEVRRDIEFHLEHENFDEAHALAQQYDFNIDADGVVSAPSALQEQLAREAADRARPPHRSTWNEENDAIAGTGMFSQNLNLDRVAREVWNLLQQEDAVGAIERARMNGYEIVLDGNRPMLVPTRPGVSRMQFDFDPSTMSQRELDELAEMDVSDLQDYIAEVADHNPAQAGWIYDNYLRAADLRESAQLQEHWSQMDSEAGLRPEDLDTLGVEDPEAHARAAQRLMDEVDPPQVREGLWPAIEEWFRAYETATTEGARQVAWDEIQGVARQLRQANQMTEYNAMRRAMRNLRETPIEPSDMRRARAMAEEDGNPQRELMRRDAAERAAGGPLENLSEEDLRDLFDAMADEGNIPAARGIGQYLELEEDYVDARLAGDDLPAEGRRLAEPRVDPAVASRIRQLLREGEVEDAVSLAEAHDYVISPDEQSIYHLDQGAHGAIRATGEQPLSLRWDLTEGSTDEFIDLLDDLEAATQFGRRRLPRADEHELRVRAMELFEGDATESAENLLEAAGYRMNEAEDLAWPLDRDPDNFVGREGIAAERYVVDQSARNQGARGVASPITWGLIDQHPENLPRLLEEIAYSTHNGRVPLSDPDEQRLIRAVEDLLHPGEGGTRDADNLLRAAGYELDDEGTLLHIASQGRQGAVEAPRAFATARHTSMPPHVREPSEMSEAEMMRQQRLGLQNIGRAHDLGQPFEPSDLHPAPKNLSTSHPAREADSFDEALAWARSGNHLKYSNNARERFVGAPTDMPATREGLQAFRDNADEYFARGLAGLRARGLQPRWYENSRDVIGGLARDQAGAERFARELSLMSSDAPPQPDYAWSIEGHNLRAVGGEPLEGILHTTKQWKAIQRDPVGPLSMKTEAFAKTLTPGSRGMTHPVTDRQMMDALGYPLPKGVKNASPTQHRFIDAEMLLATERARDKAHNGRSDWTVEDLQETIWLVAKAEGLMRQFDIPWDDAFERAMSDFSDYVTWHRAYAEHSPRADFTDERGRDILYDAIDFYQEPVVELEAGGTRAARPQVTVGGVPTGKRTKTGSPAKTGKAVSDTDLAALEKVEAFRAAMGGADEALAYKEIPVGSERGGSGATMGQATGFTIEHGEKLTAEALDQVVRIAEQFGFNEQNGFVRNLGTSTLVTRTDGPRGGLTRDLPAIHGALAESGVPVTAGGLYPSRTDSVRTRYDWSEEGSGAVVRELFRKLDSPLAPKVFELLDNSPEARARVAELMERDAERAVELGINDRQDFRNMRRIYAEGGLTALRQALEDGAWLPSIVLPLLIWAMDEGEQDAL